MIISFAPSNTAVMLRGHYLYFADEKREAQEFNAFSGVIASQKSKEYHSLQVCLLSNTIARSGYLKLNIQLFSSTSHISCAE